MMKNYIKGILQKIIFDNGNGYVIATIKIKETNDDELNDYINKSMTFTGYFDTLNENSSYILYGNIINHPKYGMQYQVDSYEQVKPDDKDGVKEFLCSDLFSGIGEKLASSIVDILGDDALNRIIEDKNCLTLVPKLSIKKANQIYDTLIKYEESHKTIVYLTELGFTMHDALTIYNLYKNNTLREIEHNIYDILDKTDEISFPKVDSVALKQETYEEINRVKSCIIYIMKSLIYKNGDTYLLLDDIKNNVQDYLQDYISDELFDDYLNELSIEGKVIIEDNKYYIVDIYKSEMFIVSKFKRILQKDEKEYKKIDNIISVLEKNNAFTYSDKQKEAIKMSLKNRITVITGGPGTGKTTIVKAIIEAYKSINKISDSEVEEKIASLAPTGRAAKRLSESTGLLSSTIHRFLKWNKENNEFGINEFNKVFHKLIIIDEASMIDINLFASLLKGLTDDIQIILVGDYNQLPSVGPGQVLKDIIESNVIPIIELDLLYRQDEESYIPILSNEIKNNCVDNFLQPHDDYQFLKCNSDSIKSNLCHIAKQIIDKGYNYKNFQIMAPTYLGLNGIDILNKTLQDVFNPNDGSKKEYKSGNITYRENDKVLELVNMPDDNVFNGDIGIIEEIIPATISESKREEIYINFDGNIIKYLPKDLNKIKHGYAISIHKSQGSEFDVVILVASQSAPMLLTRNLIYTAMTRAKKLLIVIGPQSVVSYMIQNNTTRQRNTGLTYKLEKIGE